jgi:5-methylcytosine-specific restriction endonuclease McrA
MAVQKRSGYQIVILEPTKTWIKEDKCGGCGLSRSEWKKKRTTRCCSKECTKKMNDNYVYYGWTWMRPKIFERDNYTCRLCGFKAEDIIEDRYYSDNQSPSNKIKYPLLVKSRNSQLDADHIMPISIGGDEWDMNNIQTLCKQCHKAKTKNDIKKISVERKISIDQTRLV